MEKEIKLDSRGGIKNTLIFQSAKFALKSEFENIRVGFNDEGTYTFIDPPGGPFMSIGSVVNGIPGKLQSIEHGDKGFILVFG